MHTFLPRSLVLYMFVMEHLVVWGFLIGPGTASALLQGYTVMGAIVLIALIMWSMRHFEKKQ